MAGEDVMHFLQEPITVMPLVTFIDKSSEILKELIGPALLAWSAMYGLNFYAWLIDTTRNFNLPILYGQPMAGKTLIASCAAWLNGCTDIHIASRCTLAFITQWLKSSTMPFVWDDPSSADDVAQLAVDLGCRAIRGNPTDDPRTPQTGCLVTANFDLSNLLRFFSRLLIIYIPTTDNTKEPGKARELENAAKAASATFPSVMKLICSISEDDLFQKTRTVRETLEADLRIVQGIAFPLLITEKILRLVDKPDLMEEVNTYLEVHLYPYYRNNLNVLISTVQQTQDNMTINDIDLKVLAEIETTIIRGESLAVKRDCLTSLWADPQENYLRKNAIFNKTTRLNGKPTKCVIIPKRLFNENTWKDIVEVIQGGFDGQNEQTHVVQLNVETEEIVPGILEDPQNEQVEVVPFVETEDMNPVIEEDIDQNELARVVSSNVETEEIVPAIEEDPQNEQVEVVPFAETEEIVPTIEEDPQNEQVEVVPFVETEEIVPAIAEDPQNEQVEVETEVVLPVVKLKSFAEKRICTKCKKAGAKTWHWLECNNCHKSFHRKCTKITIIEFKKMQKDIWKCCIC